MSIKGYFENLKQERNKKQRKENVLKVLYGIMIGSAIGGAAGILFAPKAGKETRQEISGKVKKSAAFAKEKIRDTVEEVKEQVEGLKEKKSAIVDKIGETAEEVKESLGEAREAVSAAKEDLKKGLVEIRQVTKVTK